MEKWAAAVGSNCARARDLLAEPLQQAERMHSSTNGLRKKKKKGSRILIAGWQLKTRAVANTDKSRMEYRTRALTVATMFQTPQTQCYKEVSTKNAHVITTPKACLSIPATGD